MATGYLTPQAVPANTICRVLFIPDDLDWVSLVTGALEELTYSDNFTQFGAVSPDTAAAVFGVMFDDFCFNRGACRVIGEIVTMASTTNPDPVRWLPCDGASLLRTDYPELFAAISTTYGFVDATHFSLPDLRGRVPMDTGTGPGLTARSLGDILGEENHQLTVAELASHVHTTGNSILIATAVPPPLDVLGPNPFPAITGSSGNDVPHNTIQPSLALNFYIVATE